MIHSASNLLQRNAAVQAVRAGASITETARRTGVSRPTLYRWLKAFDPDKPRASLRPQKRGPKSPRWEGEVIDTVIKLIRHYPDLWGRHRVALALAEHGIIVSEATVSRMLPVARKRIEIEHDRDVHERRSRRSRQVAARARREKRDARREEEAQQWIEQNITPDLTPEEAFHRIGVTLAKTAWKLKVKHLTPTLRDLADAYRSAVCNNPDLAAEDAWFFESHKWRDQDYAHVAALNHWVKRFRRGDCSDVPVWPLSITS
jgi:transposase